MKFYDYIGEYGVPAFVLVTGTSVAVMFVAVAIEAVKAVFN